LKRGHPNHPVYGEKRVFIYVQMHYSFFFYNMKSEISISSLKLFVIGTSPVEKENEESYEKWMIPPAHLGVGWH
jgi:hypothetical protein